MVVRVRSFTVVPAVTLPFGGLQGVRQNPRQPSIVGLMPVPDSFSIGEAAAILGISAPTLRAWERRYGILKPRRTRTNQRRYTVSDLQVLARVREATSRHGVQLRRAIHDERGRFASGSGPQSAVALEDGMVWRFVVDLFDQPILLVDMTGRVLDVNQACATKLGVDRRHLTGRRLSTYLRGRDRSRLESIIRPPLQQRRDVVLTLSTLGGTHELCFDCWPIGQNETVMLALIGRTVEPRDLPASQRGLGRPGSSGAGPST